ncbi:MAG TPA: XrtA system polysaccharide chain length determinant [Gammaproteobacteria bacterium]|nr:XrtA system polysaccharide chain length determinant [Gammaproteobacteria bacterium]
MHELLEELLRYGRGIWRFRWVALAVMWLVCLVGWTLVMRMPDQYEAAARIHIDTQSVLRPLLRGIAISSDSERSIELMTRTLLSRPNLEKLTRMTDMDIMATTPNQKESLLDNLGRSVRITKVERNEDLYTIAYSSQDRELARRVVQSIITIWVESTLGESRSESQMAQRFIEEQIREYEQRLNLAEQRLADFKRQNVGMMPGSGSDYYARLQAATADLAQAQLAMQEMQNRRNSLQNQITDFQDQEDTSMSLFSGASGGAPTAVDARLQSLQSQLDELLLRFTENHPDVIEMRRLVASLERQRREEQRKQAEIAPLSTSNPMLQQMQMQLSETDAQIASMNVRVEEFQRRVDHLKNMVDTVPQVEAELKRLNRDYEVNKLNHEELLLRRESASMSEQADVRGDDVKFKVIDPPRVPLAPSGPDRLLFMSLVLLGSLVAGGGAALMLSLVRPTFDDTKAMKDITGIPVLGVVSMVRTEEYMDSRRLAITAFTVAWLTLLVAYGGVAAIEIMDLDLIAKVTTRMGLG